MQMSSFQMDCGDGCFCWVRSSEFHPLYLLQAGSVVTWPSITLYRIYHCNNYEYDNLYEHFSDYGKI